MKITNFQARRIFNFLLNALSSKNKYKAHFGLYFDHYVVNTKSKGIMHMYDVGLRQESSNEFLAIYAFDEAKKQKLPLTIASKYDPCAFCNFQYMLLLAKMLKMSKKGHGLFYGVEWYHHDISNVFLKAHTTLEEILMKMDMNLFKVDKTLI